MIYLKPMYGLCNRVRTIDSAISLCKKYKQNLTILWVKDINLNCSYDKIFTLPKFKDFEFNVIECPVGFPENYAYNVQINKMDYTQFLEFQLKNNSKDDILNECQKEIKRHIENIRTPNIILDRDLRGLYLSNNYLHLSSGEIDTIFLSKVSLLVETLFELKKSSFISSCYRLYPIKNNYKHFIPAENIKRKVDNITKKFNHTIGLHIRRKDHLTSVKYSTTDKFIQVINERLKIQPKTTFFLSTDDDNTKKIIVSKFGKIIITNDIDSFDRNKEIAIIDAAIDLFCLAKTKLIYGSHHSTFSQTSASIGLIEEITVK